MLVAAGTGGHIYPGLAIADYFISHAIKVSWVGTSEGMENSLVDKNKISFFSICFSGIRGKGILPWLQLPFMLMIAIIQSLKILKEENKPLKAFTPLTTSKRKWSLPFVSLPRLLIQVKSG